MATYNLEDVAKLKHVNTLAALVKGELDKTIKFVSASGNTVSFFTTDDGSGTAAFSFNFPEELFLDQVGTTLVDNFSWSALSYPNSTNPNLNGKTVLVLAVKGDATTPTVKYSFVDLSKLIDTYTAADNSINISGYSVAVKISATTGNALSLTNDGLFVDTSDKVDKVTNAPQGEIAIFGLSGAIVAGGLSLADIQTGGSGSVDVSGKIDKVTSAVAGNIATFGASGALADSGVSFASDSAVAEMLSDVFGAGAVSSILGISSVTVGAYSDATSLQSGLMSAADKTKLDNFTVASDSSVIVMLNGVFGAGSISSIERA